VQRAASLAPPIVFTNLAQHIFSTPPENVFFDASATNASQYYYRIKLE
jgi:hypothetical protein